MESGKGARPGRRIFYIVGAFLLTAAVIFAAIRLSQNLSIPAEPTLVSDPLQAAFSGVTHNVSWPPYERDFDGVPMVLVPSGCFMMGGTTPMFGETPIHQQCIARPFWIDKYEVTQAQFHRFDGVQETPPRFSGDNRPVENINWGEARDFCALRGGRLPTEAEWEFAARGPDSLVYTWGNEWNPANMVWNRTDEQGTADVGSIEAGVSWVGAQDMSGNVWEWTNSLDRPYPYDAADGRENEFAASDNPHVLRGGSWVQSAGGLYTGQRLSDVTDRGSGTFGMRCARTYE